MALYTTGTATGPGANDAFFQAIRAQLTANSWTEHDVINDSVGTRDIVFRGSILGDTTPALRPFVRVTEVSTTKIGFRGYADWDTTNHAGMAECGNATSNSYMDTQDASFVYFMRANGHAFALCAKIGLAYHKNYQGFARRGLPTTKSGVGKVTSSKSVGNTVLALDNDLTGKLKVGQKIMIMNYAHNSASGNKENAEIVTVASVGSSTITISALTKNYDAGAIVGQHINQLIISHYQPGGSPPWQSQYQPYRHDGTYVSTTNHTVTFQEVFLNVEANTGPDNQFNDYSGGFFSFATSTASYLGHIGYPYHWEITASNGGIALEDIMDDGDNTYIVLYSDSGRTLVMGPRN